LSAQRALTAAATELKVNDGVSLLENYQRDTEHHMPYEITQFYLPPNTGERAKP